MPFHCVPLPAHILFHAWFHSIIALFTFRKMSVFTCISTLSGFMSQRRTEMFSVYCFLWCLHAELKWMFNRIGAVSDYRSDLITFWIWTFCFFQSLESTRRMLQMAEEVIFPMKPGGLTNMLLLFDGQIKNAYSYLHLLIWIWDVYLDISICIFSEPGDGCQNNDHAGWAGRWVTALFHSSSFLKPTLLHTLNHCYNLYNFV